MDKYAYLIGDIVFLTIWLVLYLLRKDIRKEMLTMSLILAIVGPLSEYWYFKDYWYPKMVLEPLHPFGGLEDLLFGFAAGGVGAVLYEFVFTKHLSKRISRNKVPNKITLLLIPIIIIISLVLLNQGLGINSIYASSISFLIIFSLIMIRRSDLFLDALLSGILLATIMGIFYYIFLQFVDLSKIWFLYGGKDGHMLLGRIPLTEMVWAITWGMVGGPLYEFARGYKLK